MQGHRYVVCGTLRSVVAFLLTVAVLAGPRAAAGTITITKAKMLDKSKSPEGETACGAADGDCYVSFRAQAACSDCSHTVTYDWYFGDGSHSCSKDPDHKYGTGGYYNPYLEVTCSGGCPETTSYLGTVAVISEIHVSTIGPTSNPANNGRLSLNDVRNVRATSTQSSTLDCMIDWRLEFNGHTYRVLDQANGDLPTVPGTDWPSANSGWGDGKGTLYATMDVESGEDAELFLTGAASYIETTQTVSMFYNGSDDAKEKTGSTPNWYYYYTDALGQSGQHSYRDPANPADSNDWAITDYGVNPPLIYIGHWCNNSRQTPGASVTTCYIDTFANVVQHEKWHKLHRQHNYDFHGGTGGVPDSPDDPDSDDVCSGGCANGGWELICGTSPTDPTTTALPTYSGNQTDTEQIACAQETQGSHTAQDWAHPGKQW